MQAKNRGFAFCVARASARMAFDHALRGEMRFNPVTDSKDIAVILWHWSVTIARI